MWCRVVSRCGVRCRVVLSASWADGGGAIASGISHFCHSSHTFTCSHMARLPAPTVSPLVRLHYTPTNPQREPTLSAELTHIHARPFLPEPRPINNHPAGRRLLLSRRHVVHLAASCAPCIAPRSPILEVLRVARVALLRVPSRPCAQVPFALAHLFQLAS